MQLEGAKRIYGLLHEDAPYHDGGFENWAKKASRQFPFHANDGVSFWIAPEDVNPDDDFLGSVAPDELGSNTQGAPADE